MEKKWADLGTETRNGRTTGIDEMNTEEILHCINEEDRKIADAVAAEIPTISKVIDAIYERMKQGGRLIYVGAGTSGRLGVLDASECPPTYGTDPQLVQGYIAGGDSALRNAAEGCEDRAELGVKQIEECNVTNLDTVVGISASGSAAYVIGAIEEGKRRGALTVGLVNNEGSLLGQSAEYCIVVKTGAEVITGSTRMKAGTSQKMVLNMISTTLMVKLGKVYQNTMIDLRATNDKLRDRAKRIFSWATQADAATAEKYLQETKGDTKLAVCMYLTGLTREEAALKLKENDGRLKQTLKII